MQPFTYGQVAQEYDTFRAGNDKVPVSLEEFAQMMDKFEGVPKRQLAYNDNFIKRASHNVDSAIASTGLPAVGKYGAQAFGDLLNVTPGTQEVLGTVGETLPRAVGEGMLTLLAPEAQIPRAVAYGARALGYGSAAAKGYTDSDSVLGGAVGAGTLAAGNYLAPWLGNKAFTGMQNLLSRNIPMPNLPAADTAGKATFELLGDAGASTALRQVAPAVAQTARVGAEMASGVPINEVARQGMLSASGVPLTDWEQRNPFTEENIAANVVGVGAFAPFYARSIMNAPKTNIKAVEALGAWMKDRETFLRTQTPEQTPGGLKITADPSLEQAYAANPSLKASRLRDISNAYAVALRDGNVEWQTELEGHLKRTLFMSQDAPKPELLKQEAANLSNIAQHAAPDSPGAWDMFINEVNTVIKQYNDNLVDPNVAKTEKTKGKIWHPSARQPEVIERLQKGGYLPEITPEYLADQYKFFLDRSIGDPEFASRAVAQKVTNDLFDRIEDALAREGAERKVEVIPGKRRAEEQAAEFSAEKGYQDALNDLYTKALLQLEPEDRQKLFDRHVEMQEAIDAGKGDFMRGGFAHTYFPGWRDMVIQAAQTYDPVSKTFKYKAPVRTPDAKTGAKTLAKNADGSIKYVEKTYRLEDLWRRGADKGKYALYPESRVLKPSEGGKLKGGEISLDTPINEGETGHKLLADDETQFWTDLGEGKYRPGEFKTTTDLETGETVGTASDYVTPVDEPNFLSQSGSADELNRWEAIGEQVKKKTTEWSPAELWSKVKEFYVQYNPNGMERASSQNSFRAQHFKLALRALAEEGYLNKSGGKAAQDRPLGKAAKEFVSFAKSRMLFVPNDVSAASLTERQFALKTLTNFFRRGNEPLTDMMQKVMSKIVEPGDLSQLRTPPRASEDLNGPVGLSKYFEDQANHRVEPGGAGFGTDYFTTTRWRIYKVLGQMGYSGTSRDWLTEIVAAVAAKGANMNTEFKYLGSDRNAGIAAATGDKIGVIGVKMNPFYITNEKQAVGWAVDVIRTALHELAHIDQFVLEGIVLDTDVYTQQHRALLHGLDTLANQLSPEERDTILKTMRDGFLPKEFHQNLQNRSDGTIYGSESGTEFTAQVRSMVELMLIAGTEGKGKKTWKDVLTFLPAEVEQYMRGQFRTIGDVLDAVRQVVTYPEYNPNKVGSAYMGQSLEHAIHLARAVSEFRQPDIARAAGRKLMSSLEPGGVLGMLHMPTATRWLEGTQTADGFLPDELPPAHIARSEQVINDLGKIMFADPTEKGAKPGFFDKLKPFYNMLFAMERRGVPLAGAVWDLATSITPMIHRFESSLLNPFLTRNAQGRYEFDSANPLIAKIAKEPTGKWRTVFNKLRKWQNEHEFKPIFAQTENGIITVTAEGKDVWAGVSKLLTPEDQQVIMNGMVAMDKVYQQAAAHLVTGMFDRIKYRVAATLMSRNRQMTNEQARGLAGEILAGYVSGDTSAVAGKIPPDQLQGLTQLLVGDGQTDKGLLGQFEKVKRHLLSRQGFSSEQLPHDWIIQYKTPEGETRYISAETQKGAEHMAKRLQGEGNRITAEIINKKDVSKYSDFDDPSEVLTKFIEIEGQAWSKYVDQLATTNPELAAQIRDEFSVGDASSKELQRQGLKKFMLENEGKVDTNKLDYLEAMGAYVNRLSASLAFREVREQLNLIMNDPRGKPYRTFKQQVADHFSFIFSATPKELSEWKSMLSGYYMGANLSSAFIESTQSLTTLVPTLLNLGKGSIADAYHTLWSGIKDLTTFSKRDWQSEARRAEMAGPNATAEQERLLMYKRAVEEGLIDHGVIQDMNYGRDQRLLTTAKFGRGEFSEVTTAQMVKDKAYVGSQMMMQLYSWAAVANTKISFLSGVRQGQALGLKGDALYRHARRVKDLSTFGGGKANMPTYVSQWSSPYTRNAFVMMHTLQQYGMGMFATYTQLARDSIAKNLPPLQRRQAQKSLGVMLMTQTAMAGVLGLPFAAAALTMLEKTFGIEANKAVREGLASLAGRDEDGEISEAGAVLADTVLNGAGNQLFGLDISSRAGTSNLFGTSAYRGFNVADMLGPVPGVIENMYTALGNFGHGEPVKAVKALVPQAFKNAIDMADTKMKYGDTAFRDKTGDMLYQPTQGQVAAYMLGFRPRELSAKRQAQTMLALSEDNAILRRQKDVNAAARALVRGDSTVAQQLAFRMMQDDPMTKYDDVMRMVVNQAADLQLPKDPTRTGVGGNDANRQEIARLSGVGAIETQSELQRTMLMMQSAARLGRPQLVGPQALQRAAMIDAMVNARGMSRSQAVKLLEFIGQ